MLPTEARRLDPPPPPKLLLRESNRVKGSMKISGVFLPSVFRTWRGERSGGGGGGGSQRTTAAL